MAKKKTPAQIQAEEAKRFQAEDDLRTLRRAEEVKSDSSRLRSAQTIAKEEMQALQKVQGVGRSKKKKVGK